MAESRAGCSSEAGCSSQAGTSSQSGPFSQSADSSQSGTSSQVGTSSPAGASIQAGAASRIRPPLQPQDTAKSIYCQEVENACDVKPLIKQMERCFESSESENGDSDESEQAPMPSTSSAPPTAATKKKKMKKKKRKKRGEDRIVHGVLTTKEDRRKAKLRHFNFSSMDPERQWLRDVLLTSTESSSDEDTPEAKDRRIKEMLKERRIYLKYQRKFNKDNPKHQHMYYSSGLLSAVDHYPEYRARRPAPPPRPVRGRGRGRSTERGKTERVARTIPERGKGKAVEKAKPVTEKPTRGVKTRRGRAKDTPPPKAVTEPLSVNVETSDALTLDWEEHLQSMTLPALTDTEDDYMTPIGTGPDSRPGTSQSMNRNRTLRKVDPSSPEVMAAKRRRHWLMIAKKEVGKLHRSRQAAHKEALIQRKRLANMCCKHVRTAAMQSQKNTKETPWRCKRLNREMQSYWRRYDRAEKETRKRMEKEAEEQRKMDVELIEAKRQRRKLNFLITQTELYAHFMQRKALTDCDKSAELILHQLDEEDDPRLAGIDPYDSAAMKAKAAQNAREAFRAERARTQQFDAQTGISPEEEVDVVGDGETRRGGDFDQPSIFTGVLKGYQLKGMNWLANLYDQGISGILADEMGLGKTVQCIAFLCHVAERLGVWGPFLVVSPASTLHNWQQEMERFAPDFKVVPYWGSPSERKILRQFWSRKDLHTRTAAFHVVITSYQIVVSDLKYLNRVSWQYMILDEAQAIKSTHSIRWKLLLGFSCRNRLLLSGTPIQNSMAELWALLHFIMPTLFDSHEEFNEWFSKDIESHAENKSTIDEKHLSRLHMILKPFMLRRIKKDVENELSDKIEIMVHCPLTIRQKLLYIALKKKIKIEELLHYSVGAESGHNVDKNFTSNLMNLVMQFRKVCNHPELFERRDVRSPFSMQVDDYHVPKLIADDGILIRAIPSKRHLLYNKLSVLTPDYINESLKEGEGGGHGLQNSRGLFAFTRLTNLSPMEVYKVALCGWLYAMQHIEASMDTFERVRHRINWWFKMYEVKGKSKRAVPTKYYDKVRVKNMLYICPDGDTLNQKKGDGIIWSELLFTDPVWIQGGPFFTHADHTLHHVPETIEHRAMRHKHYQANNGEWLEVIKDESGEILSIQPEPPSEFPHVERPPVLLPMMATPLLKFLYTAQPKVSAETRAPFAVSRSFAYHVTRHQHAENADGGALLARFVAACRPPHGWVSLQVPDKNQLVSDAGKLTVLDSLLKRLKERGHRVLIYSQMTKMIDLLEEYMCYRKHKYMRLDGSSKISARRDMVADFQARTDIFVFLLSTRAGGLGINLTAADTVIFYDSDWNPTVDQQAMDRAHRLGQTKQVTVYRLICKGTIEERIMQRAREKSEIQRMVISGGNFKPDTLKPKEVVSLLLDDEEIEQKYRQKSEEKRREERERKKKNNLLPSVLQPSCSTVSRSSHFQPSISAIPAPKPWGPNSPLLEDDDSSGSTLVVDIPPPPSPIPMYSPPPRGIVRGVRGSRRGRPRGSRCVGTRRPDGPTSDNAIAVAAGAALLESDAPLEILEVQATIEPGRGRRGPGRPRTRAPAPRTAPRRPRRPREPLLVPLAPPP